MSETNNQTAAGSAGTTPPILEVRDYSLTYGGPEQGVKVLDDINLTIRRGETLGLVGESGSGKSSLAWAIMRYLPALATESDGAILLSGENLRSKSQYQMLDIRGRRIAMVFQDPSMSLNPTLRLGEQLSEVLIRHRGLSLQQAWKEGEAALARTGITRPAEMMKRYPHEASGGEKQRVVIATALACSPELIIFDEPTTALDVITARQILQLFETLREETDVSALYISHDLGLVSRIAPRVAVIHRGVIVEQGQCAEVFRDPREAYTRRLLAALPRPDRWLGVDQPATGAAPLLETQALNVRYGGPSLLDRITGSAKQAVDGAIDVALGVRPGELLGVVGESGSGKSTVAKVLSGLQDFRGTVRFDGRGFVRRRDFDRRYRRAVQVIFQHPDSSLNPRQTIGQILSRPLKLYGLVPAAQRPAKVAELLEKVLLPADYARRYPHQLSGGEKQRVAIARAFAAQPRLVICDEITSSLDVSVQASIARLMVGLQAETGTACIFITHDLNLVRQLAHRIAVMQHGRLVDLFDTPDAEAPERHPYTRALLEAVTPPPVVAEAPVDDLEGTGP